MIEEEEVEIVMRKDRRRGDHVRELEGALETVQRFLARERAALDGDAPPGAPRFGTVMRLPCPACGEGDVRPDLEYYTEGEEIDAECTNCEAHLWVDVIRVPVLMQASADDRYCLHCNQPLPAAGEPCGCLGVE